MTKAENADQLDRAMAQLRLVQEHQAAALFTLEDSPLEAKVHLRESANHANHAARALRLAGAHVPELDNAPREERFDLSDLAAMSSPTGRELLAGIEALQVLAERWDAERGQVIAGSGTDFGEALETLALRLRQQVGGAEGRGLE